MANLFISSFLVLFAEVMAIRWIGMEIPILRVFPNLILMIIFIGTSAGLCLHKSKGPSTPVLVVSGLLLFVMVAFAEELKLYDLSLNMESGVNPLVSVLVIALVAVNLVTLFMSLGVVLGREFAKPEPLQAYSINILGSLAGVLAFALISWLWMPGVIWVAICLLCLWFLTRHKVILLLALIVLPISYFSGKDNDAVWSPYSRIELVPVTYLNENIFGKGNYILDANHMFFHAGLNAISPDKEELLYSPEAEGGVDHPMKGLLIKYEKWLHLPYNLMKNPGSVLILGSGSGNDVSCALKRGVPKIDAVEIDPYIGVVGRTKHPDKPYADNRVTLHNEDARTFLRYSPQKFDMIQFAYLDPGHTLNMSSFLRLDNFVYTRESLKAALRHLNPGGIVFLSFATGSQSNVTRRIYETITQANDGKPPIAFVNDKYEHVFFFFGPGVNETSASLVPAEKLGVRPWPLKGEMTPIEAATDDWPFLYLTFTAGAIALYFIVLIASVVGPAVILSRSVFSYKDSIYPLGAMFFLGMAFMLVETKSITQLSLLFGATWIVSSAVITVILILAWIANRIVQRFPQMRIEYAYAGLALSIVADYLWVVPDESNLPVAVVAGVSSLIRCLPIFFGGMIFSRLLKNSTDSVYFLSANLLGVAFGGLLENLCIWTGMHNLSIAVFAIYGLSFVMVLIERKRASKLAG